MKNVVSKMCILCGETIPTYGFDPTKQATHCSKCSLHGMIDVKNKKCILCGKTQPTYGFDKTKPAMHCSKCSLPGMKDVNSKMCILCGGKQPTWGEHCAPCFAELNPDDPLVLAHNKTEEKVKLYLNSMGAGIGRESTFNMMNVRGTRSPEWLDKRELDFVLFQNRINLEVDGIQHKKDVKRFRNAAAEEQQNDFEKTELAMAHSMSVIRIDQEDIWKDRMDWRALLKAAMSFALSIDAPVCVTLRRDEGDLSYDPFLDKMMASTYAAAVYEIFLTANESGKLGPQGLPSPHACRAHTAPF
jgi:very-short-patch-repair endonuclease